MEQEQDLECFTPAMEPTPSTPCYLLQLPPELRIPIYELAASLHQDFVFDRGRIDLPSVALGAVCRTIRYEYLPILRSSIRAKRQCIKVRINSFDFEALQAFIISPQFPVPFAIPCALEVTLHFLDVFRPATAMLRDMAEALQEWLQACETVTRFDTLRPRTYKVVITSHPRRRGEGAILVDALGKMKAGFGLYDLEGLQDAFRGALAKRKEEDGVDHEATKL